MPNPPVCCKIKKKKNNKLNQIKNYDYNIETVIKINVYDTPFILGLYNKTGKTITEFLNFIITLFFFNYLILEVILFYKKLLQQILEILMFINVYYRRIYNELNRACTKQRKTFIYDE